MADDDKKQALGFAEVIRSVDSASSNELAALSRIEKKLTSGSLKSVSQISAEQEPQTSPRSVRLAGERKKELSNERRRTIKRLSNDGNKTIKNPSNNDKAKIQLKGDKSALIRKSNDGNLTVNIKEDVQKNNQQSNSINSSIKRKSYNNQTTNKNSSRDAALAALKSPSRPKSQHNPEGRISSRDENGRFTSREKVRQDNAERKESQHEREREAENKKRDSVFTRIGKMLSDSSDPLDADGTNAAGMAAGGSFWKAGHEVYTMGKNTIGGGVSSVKKMGEFLGGDKEEKDKNEGTGSAKKPGFMRRMFSRNGNNKRNSATVIAAQAQHEQKRAIEEQIKATREGDKIIADKLDELIKEHGGKKSNGMWGLLGTAALGKFGKKIASSILAGLGARKLAERLRGGVQKPRGRILGDDCGCDVPRAGSPDGKKRKPTRKERNKAIRRAGKKGLLKRIGKKTIIAGGGAAAVGDATEVVSSDEGKPVIKASEKGVSKEAESAVAKVGAKGTEEVTTKGAEKVGVKVATKAALGASLRAIPVIGQVIGGSIDALMGWRDKEGQASAFNLDESQKATRRQKAEYATANVLDMGGLVSGGSRLLSAGASKLGFNNVAKSLDFTTDDIAKGIDSKVSNAKQAVGSAVSFLGLTKSKDSETAKATEKSGDSVVVAVKDGTKSTMDKLEELFSSASKSVASAAGNVADSGKRLYARITEPSTDAVASDLNIGGSNSNNRNFRNNNFGNLQYVGQKGARLENANAKGERRFARFDTPEEGFRALGDQLMSYYNGTSKAVGYQKLQSVGQIIPKFAPESENNTKAYMATLSKQLGVGVNDKLNLQDPAVMTKVMRAISTVEGGNPTVTDAFIQKGLGKYQQGDGGKGQWVGQFNDSTLAIVNQKRQKLGLTSVDSSAQFSGIATQSGKPVAPDQPAPVKASASASRTTQNGISYRAATLPFGSSTSLGEKLANAEGLRHQIGRTGATTASADGPISHAPRTPSEGISFANAKLPIGQSTSLGNKVSSAEGLRHQTSVATPTMAIPSKLPAVTDMAGSHVQPAVRVTSEQTFPKEVKAQFDKMIKALEEIKGNTKDTADKNGDASPKANSPQPAPRSSSPLAINDPLMTSVAND
ncbi:hypothetical protein [Pantoea sp. CCBC3-3-1]|uniref:hypothetical protein n=1 Tax=Pantoea sp. CCBC3-3-1 TaxID=2490851 RepID=UPI0011BD759B|nr:hypothetical protein [Pantoea sp. CCBC3-3-1]